VLLSTRAIVRLRADRHAGIEWCRLPLPGMRPRHGRCATDGEAILAALIRAGQITVHSRAAAARLIFS
jgi:hypothetical protein